MVRAPMLDTQADFNRVGYSVFPAKTVLLQFNCLLSQNPVERKTQEKMI